MPSQNVPEVLVARSTFGQGRDKRKAKGSSRELPRSVFAVTCALSVAAAFAAGTPTAGFNNRIPEKIMTPDTVDTRIGKLEFVDGVPTVDTSRTLYDNLDFLRGVETFLNFVPAASI